MPAKNSQPRRRWLAFSLRTLFVIVTLFSMILAWGTYQINWIRERREFRNSGVGKVWIYTFKVKPIRPPWSLRIFGEGTLGGNMVELPYPEDDPEFKRIRRLFPEHAFFAKKTRKLSFGNQTQTTQ